MSFQSAEMGDRPKAAEMFNAIERGIDYRSLTLTLISGQRLVRPGDGPGDS